MNKLVEEAWKHRLIVNGKKTNVILDKPNYSYKFVQKFAPNEKLERGSIWYEFVDPKKVVTVL